MTPNKQLQPTVIPNRMRAAAELRRYTARRFVPAKSMFPFGTSVEFLADAL